MLKKILIFAVMTAILTSLSVFAVTEPKDLIGSFKTEIDMNGRPTQTFTLVVKMNADKTLSVKAEKANDDVTVQSIAVENQNVTIAAQWRGVPFEMKGTIEKDRMAGKWGTGQYSGDWRAVRIKE